MNQRLRDCIKAIQTNVSLDGLSDTDSLLDAGVLDSLAIMRLVLILQERFKVKIDMEEIHPENFDSVTRIAEFLAAKANRAGV